jgi:hypothetical protein
VRGREYEGGGGSIVFSSTTTMVVSVFFIDGKAAAQPARSGRSGKAQGSTKMDKTDKWRAVHEGYPGFLS